MGAAAFRSTADVVEKKKGVDLDLIDALNDADGFLEHTTPPAPLPLPICDERVSAAPLRRAS